MWFVVCQCTQHHAQSTLLGDKRECVDGAVADGLLERERERKKEEEEEEKKRFPCRRTIFKTREPSPTPPYQILFPPRV